MRILASAGHGVLAPRIRSYIDLLLEDSAIADFNAAFEAIRKHPSTRKNQRIGLFSISFGSLLHLSTATDPHYADDVGGVVIYRG